MVDIEKRFKVDKLLFEVDFPLQHSQFFDANSDELMDEKIEVLEALKEGKAISDIPNYYKVLELYPGKDTLWD